MFAQFFDGSNVNMLVAFLAGVVTFFASCLLPLVPTYLAFLSGVALNTQNAQSQRWHIARMALLFVVGFISTFVVLGLSLSHFAAVVGQYRHLLNQLAGMFFILLGLFMLGVFKHRLFSQERKIDIDGYFRENMSLHALITGVAFGFGWTPCIGPILAVILYWSAQAETTFTGVSLLLSYGVGLGVPFLVVALAFEKIIPLLKKFNKISYYTNILAGGVVILAGILLVTGEFQSLSLQLIHFFNIESISM